MFSTGFNPSVRCSSYQMLCSGLLVLRAVTSLCFSATRKSLENNSVNSWGCLNLLEKLGMSHVPLERN